MLRDALRKMIVAVDGGWDVVCAHLGMTRTNLENRVYERQNQRPSVELAMQLQKVSNTTFFAEWVAKESGGVFVKLPDVEECGHDELLAKFNAMYANLGALSGKFQQYTADNEIDKKERADLVNTGQQIHRAVAELLAMSFQIYCRQHADKGDQSE